jgi:hypothetical protein
MSLSDLEPTLLLLSQENDKEDAYRAGMNLFMAKPFSINDFRAALDELSAVSVRSKGRQPNQTTLLPTPLLAMTNPPVLVPTPPAAPSKKHHTRSLSDIEYLAIAVDGADTFELDV